LYSFLTLSTGYTPEGINQNPVYYEFMAEANFRSARVSNISEHVIIRSHRRYNLKERVDTVALAWDALVHSTYSQDLSVQVRQNCIYFVVYIYILFYRLHLYHLLLIIYCFFLLSLSDIDVDFASDVQDGTGIAHLPGWETGQFHGTVPTKKLCRTFAAWQWLLEAASVVDQSNEPFRYDLINLGMTVCLCVCLFVRLFV
jgi:hypothetical protein